MAGLRVEVVVKGGLLVVVGVGVGALGASLFFLNQNTNLLYFPMFLECPAEGMEGRTDPAIYPPLLHVLFTCALFE